MLVKPNWFDAREGNYTSGQTLGYLLAALKQPATVIESHSHARNDGSGDIPPGEAREHADWIRQQEAWYLSHTGNADALQSHGATYFNLTEAYWRGELAPERAVREIVEAAFGPLHFKEYYRLVPAELFERRGHKLIDFCHAKVTSPTSDEFSLCLKNMFGLLPFPSRFNYHTNLPQAILDINKVYRALFKVVNVCEAIHSCIVYTEDGRYTTPWERYDVYRNLSLVAIGERPAELDCYTSRLFGQDLRHRTMIKLGAEAFGGWDDEVLAAVPTLVTVD